MATLLFQGVDELVTYSIRLACAEILIEISSNYAQTYGHEGLEQLEINFYYHDFHSDIVNKKNLLLERDKNGVINGHLGAEILAKLQKEVKYDKGPYMNNIRDLLYSLERKV